MLPSSSEEKKNLEIVINDNKSIDIPLRRQVKRANVTNSNSLNAEKKAKKKSISKIASNEGI